MHESGRPDYGRWVAGKRSKWVTLCVWVLLALALNLLWPAVGDKEDNNAANLKEDVPSVIAEAVANKEFPSNGGVPALIVWHKENGLQEGDLIKLQELTANLESNPLPYQTFVVPFHKLPPQALSAQLSEDQSTLRCCRYSLKRIRKQMSLRKELQSLSSGRNKYWAATHSRRLSKVVA